MQEDKTIELVLQSIIRSPSIHVKWLNTLSFLEHVGTRKILKTQSGTGMDEQILRHASEEARHAHFFKKMIDHVEKGACPNYEPSSLLCGYSAYRYFQSLDSMVNHELSKNKRKDYPHAFICYLYVTTLIEERAGWLYPIYNKLLESEGAAFHLKSVISEEERHLSDMHSALAKYDIDSIKLNYFRNEEAKLYHTFFQKLKNHVLVKTA